MRRVQSALSTLVIVATLMPVLRAPLVTVAQEADRSTPIAAASDATPEGAHAQVTVAGTAWELLPQGASDTLDVIAVGPYQQYDVSNLGSRGYVPFVVRNNTSETLTDILVTLDVRSDQGALLGSGHAGDLFAPNTLEPGDVAFGIGLLDEVPMPSTPVFDFTVESRPVRESAARGLGEFRILNADVVSGQVVGQVQNETGSLQSYVEPVMLCFTEEGTPTHLLSVIVEGDGVLPDNSVLPERTATFQIGLDDESLCPKYLVAVDWT